ncbi:hypothetical protein E2C01_038915 [Portunus trituberculatus]|uniref:Uncharacterized protein n=1 Tax=Portunus trituberculatus TaxID=210409 RepID=A0A5B7FJA6_PORTR|nr:hypothetical protein [Portunus trituberculatus]
MGIEGQVRLSQQFLIVRVPSTSGFTPRASLRSRYPRRVHPAAHLWPHTVTFPALSDQLCTYSARNIVRGLRRCGGVRGGAPKAVGLGLDDGRENGPLDVFIYSCWAALSSPPRCFANISCFVFNLSHLRALLPYSSQ